MADSSNASVSFDDFIDNEVQTVPSHLSSFCESKTVLDFSTSSDDSLSRYFYSTEESSIILVFYPITFIFGVLANGLFLLVLFRIPEMRTVTNAYLGNLAICDLMLLCSVDYHFLGFYFMSPRVKTLGYNSSFGMGLNVTVQYACHFTSVALLFMVTVERYLGICKPLKHTLVVKKGRTLTLIISTWIFGFAYSCVFVAPRSYVLVKRCVVWPKDEKYNGLPNVLHSRQPIHPFYKTNPPILQVLPFIVVLACNSIMYGLIIKKLHKRVARFTNEMKQVAQIRNQVARLLIINGTIFFFLYTPFYVVRLNDTLLQLTGNNCGFKLTASQKGALDWSVVCLLTINSIINPVIYGITNERYRRAFASVFSCRRVTVDHSSYSSRTNETDSVRSKETALKVIPTNGTTPDCDDKNNI